MANDDILQMVARLRDDASGVLVQLRKNMQDTGKSGGEVHGRFVELARVMQLAARSGMEAGTRMGALTLAAKGLSGELTQSLIPGLARAGITSGIVAAGLTGVGVAIGAVAVGVAGLVKILNDMGEKGVKLQLLADQAGLLADQLERAGDAAEILGVPAEQMHQSLIQFQRLMRETTAGPGGFPTEQGLAFQAQMFQHGAKGRQLFEAFQRFSKETPDQPDLVMKRIVAEIAKLTSRQAQLEAMQAFGLPAMRPEEYLHFLDRVPSRIQLNTQMLKEWRLETQRWSAASEDMFRGLANLFGPMAVRALRAVNNAFADMGKTIDAWAKGESLGKLAELLLAIASGPPGLIAWATKKVGERLIPEPAGPTVPKGALPEDKPYQYGAEYGTPGGRFPYESRRTGRQTQFPDTPGNPAIPPGQQPRSQEGAPPLQPQAPIFGAPPTPGLPSQPQGPTTGQQGPTTGQQGALEDDRLPANATPTSFANVRYNNPGAQYPGASSAKFGSTGTGIIGGGHKIAQFPSAVHGAASNIDLLGTKYVGMKIGDALQKWSGSKRGAPPGYDPNQVITKEMVNDPNFAIPFMKAVAKGEAPGNYPMSERQWRQAHDWYRAGKPGGEAAKPGVAPGQSQTETPGQTLARPGSPEAAVDRALTQLGLHERTNRDAVKKYLKSGGEGMDPATTAWCAAFVNSSLAQEGIKGSGSGVATSFLKWGEGVKGAIQKGDVLVEARGRRAGETGGHVGMATGRVNKDGKIEMISGNEADQVNIKWIDPRKVVARRAVIDPNQRVVPQVASPPTVPQLPSGVYPGIPMAPGQTGDRPRGGGEWSGKIDDALMGRLNDSLAADTGTQTVEGSAKLTVDVKAPRGTRIGVESGGMFKETTVNRSTQMDHSYNTAESPSTFTQDDE
jgi:uncharacterized protein (TIGR02594 family)